MSRDFLPSLLNFLQTIVTPILTSKTITILDLGPGTCSVFEKAEFNKKHIEAIDIDIKSSIKINSEIRYVLENIIEKNHNRNDLYDLIFDSHCLHCLKSIEEQKTAMLNIFSYLKVDGLFASEIMVQPANEKVYFPKRTIQEPSAIENLLIACGFKIKYFIIVPQMNFYFDENGVEISCDMLRVLATK